MFLLKLIKTMKGNKKAKNGLKQSKVDAFFLNQKKLTPFNINKAHSGHMNMSRF